MDSHDEPSAEASPLISGQADNDDSLELESGQLGEGRGPRPVPDLGTRFPAFVCDQSLVDGTPSGEVQLRLPRRFESAGEPAPVGRTSLSVLDRDSVGQNKEAENLKNQVSALQASIEALTSRLDNQNTYPSQSTCNYLPNDRNNGNEAYQSRQRSLSMPYTESYSRSRHDAPAPPLRYGDGYRERSLSPYRYFADQPVGYPSARSSASYHGYQRPKGEIIKVAIYDGKTSWRDFLSQFEMAAHENGWDKKTRAVRLACNLRGSAQALLSDMSMEVKYDYDRLVAALTNRFEPANQCELYKAQIKQRIRKRDEPLTELAQNINRLTRMAYPSAVQGLRDTLAKDCFIESLNDVELELFVCQKEPDTLDDAVRVALKFEAFSQSRRKRLTAPKSGVHMQRESYDECDVTSNDIREIKAALTEIQQKSAQQANNGQVNRDGRRCYNCNENTHFQRSCPYPRRRNGNYPPPLLGSNYSSNQSNWNGPFNAQPSNNQSTVEPVNQNTGGNQYNRGSRRNQNQGNRQ